MAKGGFPRGMNLGGNMGQMLRQAQKMQEDMAKAQEELKATTYEGTAGGGVVKVTVNGDREVLSITFAPEAVDPDDVEMLQDLTMVAINDALKKAEAAATEAMGQITGGISIPGLM